MALKNLMQTMETEWKGLASIFLSAMETLELEEKAMSLEPRAIEPHPNQNWSHQLRQIKKF